MNTDQQAVHEAGQPCPVSFNPEAMSDAQLLGKLLYPGNPLQTLSDARRSCYNALAVCGAW